jgi:LmbE family N-acetylglucosaminyl deacetylase
MPEWEYRHSPEAFCNAPLDQVADGIGALIARHRPQVVITYDPEGAYQHPDHVHAARAAIAAVEGTGIPAKLYLTAMRRSGWRQIIEALRAAGEDVPDWEMTEDEQRQMAESEARITTEIDVRPVLERKRDALLAHASQITDSWFSKIPPQIVESVFGTETFIRARGGTAASVPETDLFSGLR